MPQESTVIDTKKKSKTLLSSPWKVIVYDDPVNLMEYVTLVLMKVFSYSKKKAEVMMLQVHNDGKSIVWSGEKELAELYVQKLLECQLTASLERDVR